ncbi:MAG: CHAD domain-containing protein [Mycobacteriaceae bacterium]|nr:CHAD domain-containing protein [Mycobacteriaceae bacterium]
MSEDSHSDSATGLSPGADAGTALLAALARDLDRLHAAEPAVRADEPDSVHQMRVATRRLRSLLRSGRPLLERAVVDHLRAELRWLAGLLGRARDAEVQAERGATGLDRLPAADRPPVARRLVRRYRSEYAEAHAATVAALDGARYALLRKQLSGLLAAPPLRRRATRPAPEVLARLLDKEQRRLHRLVTAADHASPSDHVAALHDVRKAAKRLRYFAEAVSPVLGTGHLARAAKTLQSVLGDHRDALASRDALAEAAAAARAAGEDDRPYLLLARFETTTADTALDHYLPALRKIRNDP